MNYIIRKLNTKIGKVKAVIHRKSDALRVYKFVDNIV